MSRWLLLFHLIPVSRHTIYLASLDQNARTLRSREHGGVLRAWNHTLRVEPAGEQRCRYGDAVQIDVGPLTGIIAALAVWIFRYGQRRWHKPVRNHLLPGGARYAADPQREPA